MPELVLPADAHAYQTFWYWIKERHQVFLNKEVGQPKPWTDDEILRSWKFCNPFRQNDRTTRWLQDNVIDPIAYVDPSLLVFNIFAFRAFNLPSSWRALANEFYGPEEPFIANWDYDKAVEILSNRPEGDNLISGAYMIRGMQGLPKSVSIPQVLTRIWDEKEVISEAIINSPTLEETQKYLLGMKYWGWGPFTVYQVVLDLTYTPFLEEAKDINTWCAFGPGAKRGLKELWPNERWTEERELSATTWLLDRSRQELPEDFPTMNLQDIEFSLCELSKYLRIERGGKMKEHYAGV